MVGQFGLTSADVKNLTVSALLAKLTNLADNETTLDSLDKLTRVAKEFGVAGEQVANVLGLTK
jgi:hypothetical protein